MAWNKYIGIVKNIFTILFDLYTSYTIPTIGL